MKDNCSLLSVIKLAEPVIGTELIPIWLETNTFPSITAFSLTYKSLFNDTSPDTKILVNLDNPDALISVTPNKAPEDSVAVPSVIELAFNASLTNKPLFIETSPSVINPPLIERSSATIKV